jgi:hypothetical protein
MHTLHYDPRGLQATKSYFEALKASGHELLATQGRQIIRNIIAGRDETIELHSWLHQLTTQTGDKTPGKN